MRAIFLCLIIALLTAGCTATKVTEQDIQAAAEDLDFGDSTSATLVNRRGRHPIARNIRSCSPTHNAALTSTATRASA